uniref:Uncharacterized protein n=1 Tax=Glossina austeni TaxID=7395 RepID=A0A1A9UGS9_GLOAU
MSITDCVTNFLYYEIIPQHSLVKCFINSLQLCLRHSPTNHRSTWLYAQAHRNLSRIYSPYYARAHDVVQCGIYDVVIANDDVNMLIHCTNLRALLMAMAVTINYYITTMTVIDICA